MLSPRECRNAVRMMTLALQRARTLLREGAAYDRAWAAHGVRDWRTMTAPQDLSAADDIARRREPWLMGEDCERILLDLSRLREPTPLDVMNYLSMIGGSRRRFRTDAPGPADSLCLRMALGAWPDPVDCGTPRNIQAYVNNPHLVMTDGGAEWPDANGDAHAVSTAENC